MQTLVTVIHVITCFLLVVIVLLQSGKGAEISTTLGGSSQTVFGSSGGANFFTRFTSGLAAVFMVTSLGLTVMGGQARKSLFESVTPATSATSQKSAPAAAPTTPAESEKAVPAQKK